MNISRDRRQVRRAGPHAFAQAATQTRANAAVRAPRQAEASQTLRGKYIAVISPKCDDASATFFKEAAERLGAHVAIVRQSLSSSSSPAEFSFTARVLGRLYDAIDFEGVPPDVVRQVRKEAGVPVFEGIASTADGSARASGALEGAVTEESRRAALQALLLSALT